MANTQMRQSMIFSNPPAVAGFGSVAGKKESEGPLAASFDLTSTDTKFGQSSWEKAETKMQRLALQTALKHSGLTEDDLTLAFSGDLLNQCISSSFCLRETGIPVLGLYGACSTMAQGLLLAAMCVAGGFVKRAAALTSSHFASSERQYRFPLGYGGQRTPTAQWTVTGSGCVILHNTDGDIYVRGATIGAIADPGISDQNQMGAAMAPAAVSTLLTHFRELDRRPEDYDCIATGDLGAIGKQVVSEQMAAEGYDLGERYNDCGVMIYDCKKQDVHAGGSGCGCSAVVLCGELLRQMQEKKINDLLFCGTGALLSPVSVNQGESIPSICHAVWLSTKKE